MLKAKKWTLKEYDEQTADEIAETLSVSKPAAILLAERGCKNGKQAISFINKENAVMHDPFLLPDMDKAVYRIIKAVQNNEKIYVYGDYDVDGITGTSVLVTFFKELGTDVSYYIPDRLTEGYGVNAEAVKKIAAAGCKLIVTVDTGITAIAESELAKELGTDMIITDHHECREELPDASAVVDPKRPDSKYPFSDLSGVGVAFKLICAYNVYISTGTCEYSEEDRDIIFDVIRDCYKKYGDIVALGTIADVMPVINENRLIIAYGLNRMAKTKNKGMKAILNAAEITGAEEDRKITSTAVGFILAPRINAAGRLGSASDAVELFLSDSDDKARYIAKMLCEKNKERQSIEADILKDAEKQISEYDIDNNKILILGAENWNHGVIGIVSSRITDKYNLPSILISFDGEKGKGSGRSIPGFDLLAAISSCSGDLLKYGGHKQAAGLTIDRSAYDKFKSDICSYANAHLTDEDTIPEISVDCILQTSDINLKLTSEISNLEPFGEGNPVPVFEMDDVRITDLKPVKDGKHTRLCFEKDGVVMSGMYFGKSAGEFDFIVGDRIDILFNLNENEFKGTVSPQMIIRDTRLNGSFLSGYEDEVNVYEYIKCDLIYPQKEHVPQREDFAALYRSVKSKSAENNFCEFNIHKFIKTESKTIGYIKTRLMLDIFAEVGLLSVVKKNDFVFSIKIENTADKKDLLSSSLYKRLLSANS